MDVRLCCIGAAFMHGREASRVRPPHCTFSVPLHLGKGGVAGAGRGSAWGAGAGVRADRRDLPAAFPGVSARSEFTAP